jgi:hypothetical protein
MTDISADLGDRWRRARMSALRSVAAPRSESLVDHDGLLVAALDHAAEPALKAVFDASLRLGNSFRGYYRMDLPLRDLAGLLPSLGAPCAAATWIYLDGEAALRSERPGCAAGALHPRACDFWREAVDGLAGGLTGTARLARHQSRGHGDAVCVDVLHVHPESPLRYGPIPHEVRVGLDAVVRTVRRFDPSAQVEFLGLSEGILFYRLGGAGGEVRVTGALEQSIRRRFPGLATRECTHRPVLSEGS